MSTDIRPALTTFISDDLLQRGPDGPVGASDDLLFSGLLDSIAVMRLVGFIETDLGASIPPEDVTLENFASIDAIARYLEARAEAA